MALYGVGRPLGRPRGKLRLGLGIHTENAQVGCVVVWFCFVWVGLGVGLG